MSPIPLTTADALRAAAGLAALGVIAYAWGIEPYRIRVTERRIGIPGLPDALDGLTICHLSDLHIGEYRRLERALERVLSGREVDLCAITGDILCGPGGIEHAGRVLSRLATRFGAYAVYGNAEHDAWTAGVPIAEGLEAQGMRVLVNRGERLAIRGCEVLIAGVDDPYLGHDDAEEAMAGSETASLTILLAHSPDIIRGLGSRTPHLILAGHTHGGQIRLPFIGAPWLHCRHRGLSISDGYYGPDELTRGAGRDLSDTRMYVCRGLGGSGIRARFLCPPEVAILTLRKEDPGNP